MQDVEGRCSEAGGSDATMEGMVESLDELITEIAKRFDLAAWEKVLRMKMRIRMATMEEMPPHPLLL
jgi:hypothetical protein